MAASWNEPTILGIIVLSVVAMAAVYVLLVLGSVL